MKDGKQDKFCDEDEEYSKLVMIRVDAEAHKFLEENMANLALGIGSDDLQIFRIKSNKEKEEEATKKAQKANKRTGRPEDIPLTPTKANRPRDGNDEDASLAVNDGSVEQIEDVTEGEREAAEQNQDQDNGQRGMSIGQDEDGGDIVAFGGPVRTGGDVGNDQNIARE